MLKQAIEFFLIWLALLHLVFSECVLEIPTKNAPLYTHKYGSRVLVVQPATTDLVLENNEEIQAYCAKNFSSFRYIENGYGRQEDDGVQKIDVICQDGILKVRSDIKIDNFVQLYDSSLLWCKEPTWNLFEIKSFPNCKNYVSYAVAALTSDKPIILAGVCYDLDNFDLRYVNYVLQQKTPVLAHQERNYPDDLNAFATAPALGNIRSLMAFINHELFQEKLSLKSISNFWLRFANYRYHSLIQTKAFGVEMSEFNLMFDVIWWENLRLGNWKQFINILEEQAMTETLSVYLGTSGEVRVPSHTRKSHDTLVIDVNCENCKTSQFDRPRHTIPEYVWSYVRLHASSAGSMEEFVIIGYNSPYIGYFTRNETIFCNDICEQISWLEPIQRTRMVPTLGIVFCCTPEDVQDHLKGFPLHRGNRSLTMALEEDFA